MSNQFLIIEVPEDAAESEVAKVPMQDVESIFRQIPDHRISPVAVDFSLKMLEINKNRLLN